MQSRITIEVDFENNRLPIIQIVYRNTEDVRDKLIKDFIESLGQSSSWCKITLANSNDSGVEQWKISPINSSKLKKEAELILQASQS